MKNILFVAAALCLVVTGCGRRVAKTTTGENDKIHSHQGCSHDHKIDGTEHFREHDLDKDHDGHIHVDGDNCGHAHSKTPHAENDHSGHPDASHDHSGHSHTETSNHSHDHAACSHGNAGGDSREDEIIFPVRQAVRTDFKVEAIWPIQFRQVIKAAGRVMPSAGGQSTVSAPVSGIVSFTGGALTEGRSVSGGQVLFTISSRGVGDGDQAVRAAAAFRAAEAEYLSSQELVKENIISQREFEASRLAWEQARAAYETYSGASSGGGTVVKASSGGYVTSLLTTQGDYVEVGQPLATISQNRRLVLRAEVPARYWQQLQTVTGANFIVPADGTTHRLDALSGKLLSVGAGVSEGTSLIPVTFEFDNRGQVAPGSYVETYLLGTTIPDALAVPVTALSEEQGLYFVYIQLDEEGYRRQEVRPGPSDGEHVLILSGITAGDRVVTRGAVNIKMASASGDIPHGHEH